MKSYTENELEIAVTAIGLDRSIRRVASEWGIPRNTLQARLQGRRSHREAAEQFQRLSYVQENKIAEWLVLQITLGLPPNHTTTRVLATHIATLSDPLQPLGKK